MKTVRIPKNSAAGSDWTRPSALGCCSTSKALASGRFPVDPRWRPGQPGSEVAVDWVVLSIMEERWLGVQFHACVRAQQSKFKVPGPSAAARDRECRKGTHSEAVVV